MHVIDLDYDATIPDRTIDQLEEAARAVGLPLRELELIGQELEVAEAFVESVRQGHHQTFLDDVPWEALEGELYRTRTGPHGGPGSGAQPAPA